MAVAAAVPSFPTYKRNDWQHWIDEDKNCLSTRDEVLAKESLKTVGIDRCRVVSGKWRDPYTGEAFTDPRELDIDHLVPLGEAYISGGSEWNSERKKQYANDLDLPEALIAVSASANRNKEAKDPTHWMPSNEEYHREYIEAWVRVKKKWGLSMDEEEEKKIMEVKGDPGSSLSRHIALDKSMLLSMIELNAKIQIDDQNVPQNDPNIVDWLHSRAERGVDWAQFALGVKYANGEGVSRDNAAAFHWYKKAAEQGYTMAQTGLGIMYDIGAGVVESNGSATRWYHRAAKQKEPSAQNNLGVMYAWDEVVVADSMKNDVAAAKWFEQAANQELGTAQYNLGIMHFVGAGVPKDYARAKEWFEKGANNKADSHNGAQFGLGFMYAEGQGVLQDDAEAVKWFEKSAKEKNPHGQFALGLMYAGGRGVPKDYIQAYAWLNLAAAKGLEQAEKERAAIEAKMTPEQINEAQKLSREHSKAYAL